ncbi:hypothetical protein Tco_0223203 [Tanacetum coccineum]
MRPNITKAFYNCLAVRGDMAVVKLPGLLPFRATPLNDIANTPPLSLTEELLLKFFSLCDKLKDRPLHPRHPFSASLIWMEKSRSWGGHGKVPCDVGQAYFLIALCVDFFSEHEGWRVLGHKLISDNAVGAHPHPNFFTFAIPPIVDVSSFL